MKKTFKKLSIDWDFPFSSIGFCTPADEINLSVEQLPLNVLFSRFMIVSVKSDSSITKRYCSFKSLSLLSSDIDDSISVQLYGLDSEKRWHVIDLNYDISFKN